MEIDLLGRFAVRRDGQTVAPADFGGRRVRQLVRILAGQRGHAVSRDALIEALWGERPPADPGTNLNVVVNRARRALGQPDLIETTDGGYQLREGAAIVVDIERFDAHVAQAREARSHDPVAAVAAARAALDLWDEPLSEDAYAEWARPHRDRLERLHQEALEILAEALLGSGSPREAVSPAAEAVARQPLREAAHVLLIRAYAAEGDQAAAVAAYLDLRQMLADELGIDPSPAAVSLYEQLLHGTLSTAGVVPRPRSRPGAPPLIGRDEELAQLLDLGSANRMAVVSGRSGWGKSRLLEALSTRTHQPVLQARALLPEREEPWSLARALVQTPAAMAVDVQALLGAPTLAALNDVLPELGVAGPVADPRSRRALAQQGLLRIIEATGPSLVIVDDLQWADSSSLDLLALLAGRSSQISSIVAYRPEEVAEGSPVDRFLGTLEELRPLRLRLGPLDAPALHELVPWPAVATALAEHTDGSPFAVLQVVRSLEREGFLARNAQAGWDGVEEPTPDRVRELAHAGQRDAVWRQFERLSREAGDVLATLSLLGRPAPSRVLTAACGVSSDEAIRLLRDLSRNHLVRHDTAGFRVDHDLVGETIRDRLDPVERARLHQQIAHAIAGPDALPDELARHLRGAGDTEAAASAFVTAARARVDRCAYREAEKLASEGLALGPDARARAALLEIRAETLAVKGDFDAARGDLRAAIADTSPGPTRSRLLTRLANATFGADDILRASEIADRALAEAGTDDAARARATYVRALVDMNLDRRADADKRFSEALELFTALGDASGTADILEARAMTAFGNGDITRGIQEFDRAAQLFADSGNLLRVITPRSTRGHGLMFAGKPQEGIADTAAALDSARSLGYAEGEAMVLWHHAEVLVECGQPAEALATAEAGLAVAQRIGHRGWTATTLLAKGVAHAALGDLDASAHAFGESLQLSGDLVMFRCWGNARLARTLLVQGRVEAAARHARLALEPGPGLAQYEARLAQCEISVHLGDDAASELIKQALQQAITGGHAMSAIRLRQLLAHAAVRP